MFKPPFYLVTLRYGQYTETLGVRAWTAHGAVRKAKRLWAEKVKVDGVGCSVRS